MVGLSDDGHRLEAIERELKNAQGDQPGRRVQARPTTGFVSPSTMSPSLLTDTARACRLTLPSHYTTASTCGPRAARSPRLCLPSGHKMYAPYGARILVAPRDSFAGAPGDGRRRDQHRDLDDTVWGGPADREGAGSPNVIGAVVGRLIETLLELGFDAMLEDELRLGRRLLEG
jgi:hypothetical protein